MPEWIAEGRTGSRTHWQTASSSANGPRRAVARCGRRRAAYRHVVARNPHRRFADEEQLARAATGKPAGEASPGSTATARPHLCERGWSDASTIFRSLLLT